MDERDELIEDCESCGIELQAEDGICPQSRRECGHHCNHSWSHDKCCWCGRQWGSE